MHIVVPIKQVPDLVEELEINVEGTDLDRDWLDYVINEFDDHALEQALLLKEAHGGTVTVVGVDTTGEMDQTFYTAIAKGADRALRIDGWEWEEEGLDSHSHARLIAEAITDAGPSRSNSDASSSVTRSVEREGPASAIQDASYDLVLTGVQAAGDRDGQAAPLLAAMLGLPCVNVVAGIEVGDGVVTVHKEYAGGLMAEFEVDLPAVIGVQAAAQAPRYAAISRVRQAMKSAEIEELEPGDAGAGAGSRVRRMYVPEAGERAEIIEGDEDEVAARLVEILAERGIL